MSHVDDIATALQRKPRPTYAALAEEFGVSRSCVAGIAQRRGLHNRVEETPRTVARAAGRTTYPSARTCRSGHEAAERRVVNGTCCACERLRQREYEQRRRKPVASDPATVEAMALPLDDWAALYRKRYVHSTFIRPPTLDELRAGNARRVG